jgi:hypothetical protein
VSVYLATFASELTKLSEAKEQKRESYGRQMLAAAPFAAASAVTDVPKGWVDKYVEQTIRQLPAAKRESAARAAIGRGVGRLSAGLLTSPVFLSGIKDLRSDDPERKKRGYAKVLGSGVVFSSVKGGIEGGIIGSAEGKAHAIKKIKNIAGARGILGLGGAILTSQAIATATKDKKKGKKEEKKSLWGRYGMPAAVGAATGAGEGAFEHAFAHRKNLSKITRRGLAGSAAGRAAASALGTVALTGLVKKFTTPGDKKVKDRPGYRLVPSKKDPSKKRWQKVASERQGKVDLSGYSFRPDRSLKPKELTYRRHVRRRFASLHKILEEKGVDTGAQMKRIVVPKRVLSKTDMLEHLGFVPVVVAVPEVGQTKLQSYRHPLSNHHIHDHGDSWVIHDDVHPSTTMLWLKRKLKEDGKLSDYSPPHKPKSVTRSHKSSGSLVRTTLEGMPHLIGEGVPGMAAWAKAKAFGLPGMKERVREGIDPSALRRMGKWSTSKLKYVHKQGYRLLPSKKDPSVKRWQKVASVQQPDMYQDVRQWAQQRNDVEVYRFMQQVNAEGMGERSQSRRAAYYALHDEMRNRGHRMPEPPMRRRLEEQRYETVQAPTAIDKASVAALAVSPGIVGGALSTMEPDDKEKILNDALDRTFIQNKLRREVSDDYFAEPELGRVFLPERGKELPGLVAHEIGHTNPGALRRATIAHPSTAVALRAGSIASIAIPLAILMSAGDGRYATRQELERKAKLTSAVGTLAAVAQAPGIAEEVVANAHAVRLLKQVGDPDAVGRVVRQAGPGFATYVAPLLVPMLAAHHLRRRARKA